MLTTSINRKSQFQSIYSAPLFYVRSKKSLAVKPLLRSRMISKIYETIEITNLFFYQYDVSLCTGF